MLVGIAILTLLTLAIAATAVLLKKRAEQRFDTTETAVNGLALPTGAVEQRKFAEERGRGLDAYACISASCPFVRRLWFVPIATGQEQQVTRSVLTRSGYRIVAEPRDDCTAKDGSAAIERLCTLAGTNGQLRVSVTLKTIGQETPPNTGIPAGQEWRLLQVDAWLR